MDSSGTQTFDPDATRGTRPTVPPRRNDERVDSMRIGGLLLLTLAGLDVVQTLVISFWFGLDISLGNTVAAVLFEALLGAALLRGSNGARKFVLWSAGLSLLLVPFLVVGLFVIGFGHLWPIVAMWSAITVGVFVLTMSAEPRRHVALGALALIAVGWIGSVTATFLLIGSVDFVTMAKIVQWSSARRTVEDAEAGITMTVPASWAALRDGNPFAGEDKPLATLAHMQRRSVAELERQASDAETLDAFLDTVVDAKSRSGKVADVKVLGRSDVTVGGVAARRMKVSWKKDRDSEISATTAWKDADVFYTLTVTSPVVLARRVDGELNALDQSLALTQPWTTFLRDTAPGIQTACPLLSDRVILPVARAVHRDAPPEAYCREGYRLALLGQPSLEPASRQRLTLRMRAFFSAVGPAASDRFGAYIERLRTGQPTTPKEDKAMMDVIRRAVNALKPDVQDDLREQFATAVAVGQFSASLGPR